MYNRFKISIFLLLFIFIGHSLPVMALSDKEITDTLTAYFGSDLKVKIKSNSDKNCTVELDGSLFDGRREVRLSILDQVIAFSESKKLKLPGLSVLADLPVFKEFSLDSIDAEIPFAKEEEPATLKCSIKWERTKENANGLVLLTRKQDFTLFYRLDKGAGKGRTISDIFPFTKDVDFFGKQALPRAFLVASTQPYEKKFAESHQAVQVFLKDIADKEQTIRLTQPGFAILAYYDLKKIAGIVKKAFDFMGIKDDLWFSFEAGTSPLLSATAYAPTLPLPPWMPKFLSPVTNLVKGGYATLFIRFNQTMTLDIGFSNHVKLNVIGDPLDIGAQIFARISAGAIGAMMEGDLDGIYHDVFGIKGFDFGNASVLVGIDSDEILTLGMNGICKILKKEYDASFLLGLKYVDDAVMPTSFIVSLESDKIGVDSIVSMVEVMLGGIIYNSYYKRIAELYARASTIGMSDDAKKDALDRADRFYDALKKGNLVEIIKLHEIPAIEVRDALLYLSLPVLPTGDGNEEEGSKKESAGKLAAIKAFGGKAKGGAGNLLSKLKLIGAGAAVEGTLYLFGREIGSVDLCCTMLGGLYFKSEFKSIDLGLVDISDCLLEVTAEPFMVPSFIISGKTDFLGASAEIKMDMSEKKVGFKQTIKMQELFDMDIEVQAVKKHKGKFDPQTNCKDYVIYAEAKEDAYTWFKNKVGDKIREDADKVYKAANSAVDEVEKWNKKLIDLNKKIISTRKKVQNDIRKIEKSFKHIKAEVDRLARKIKEVRHDLNNCHWWEKPKYWFELEGLKLAKFSADKALDTATSLAQTIDHISADFHPELWVLMVEKKEMEISLVAAKKSMEGFKIAKDCVDTCVKNIEKVGKESLLKINLMEFEGSMKEAQDGKPLNFHVNLSIGGKSLDKVFKFYVVPESDANKLKKAKQAQANLENMGKLIAETAKVIFDEAVSILGPQHGFLDIDDGKDVDLKEEFYKTLKAEMPEDIPDAGVIYYSDGSFYSSHAGHKNDPKNNLANARSGWGTWFGDKWVLQSNVPHKCMLNGVAEVTILLDADHFGNVNRRGTIDSVGYLYSADGVTKIERKVYKMVPSGRPREVPQYCFILPIKKPGLYKFRADSSKPAGNLYYYLDVRKFKP